MAEEEADAEQAPPEANESIGKEGSSVPGFSDPVVEATPTKLQQNSGKVVPMNSKSSQQIVDMIGHKLEQQVRRKTKYKSRREIEYSDDDSQEDETGPTNPNLDEINYLNTQGAMVKNKPNPRFRHYKDVFQNLLKQTSVTTMYPIVSVTVTYDSTKAITVTKKNEREYYVKQYDLETYEMTFEEKIGGGEDNFIKLKEIE